MSLTITSVKAPCFQGRNINHELSPATLITGETFSGKSSVVNALVLSLYGYVPWIKNSSGEPRKENSSVFKWTSDPKELFVRTSFSNGKSNQLVISKDSGTYSRKEDVQIKFPSVLMDVQEYFGYTGQKRLSYVLERVDMRKAGYKDEALLELLSEFPKSTISEIEESIEDRKKSKKQIHLWLDSLIADHKDRIKMINVQIKALKYSAEQGKVSDIPREITPDIVAEADKAVEVAAAKISGGNKNSYVESIAEAKTKIESINRDILNLQHSKQKQEEEIDGISTLDLCDSCRKKWIGKVKESIEADEKRITQSKSEVEKLSSEVQKLIKKSESEKIPKHLLEQLEAARCARSQLRAEELRWMQYEEKQKVRKASLKNLEEKEQELETEKKLMNELTKYQSKLVQKSFNTLLETANQVTAGIMRGALRYEDGEIGYMRDGVWVNHECFSGTEKLLAYAGLQIALCVDAPSRIVIMDEYGRMSTERKQEVATRMMDLLRKGVLDQWIILDPSKDWLTGKLRSQISVIEIK